MNTPSKEENIPSINFDQKQRINLRASALDTLSLDAETFCGGLNRTGFLNELLRRCAAGSDASIDLAVKTYKAKLEKMLENKMSRKDMDSPAVQKAIRALTEDYQKELEEKALSWPRGASVLFRLSNDNCRAFYGDYGEAPLYRVPTCFRGKVSRYMKAIIEEYASHTLYEREALFFHEEISLLQMAKESEKVVRLQSGSAQKKKTWDVRIYGILPDDSGLYHYLIGMVVPAAGAKNEEHIASLRLSRIHEIRVLDSRSARSGHLSDTEKKAIDKRISKSRVQFLASSGEDIVVKFNENGKSTFDRVLYMRPKVDSIDDNGFYHFSCSRLQAEYYFERLGGDAEILQPAELREKLAARYEKAHQVYG